MNINWDQDSNYYDFMNHDGLLILLSDLEAPFNLNVLFIHAYFYRRYTSIQYSCYM